VRGGFDCLGYARETQWRHTSTAPFVADSSTSSSTQGATVSVDATSSSLPFRQAPSSAVVVKSAAPNHAIADALPLLQTVSLDGFQGDFSFAHTFSNFVWRGYGSQWLEQAAQGKLGTLALDSIKALSWSTFGKSAKLADMQYKGSVQYGKCLRMLAQEMEVGSEKAVAKKGLDGSLVVPILLLLMHAVSKWDLPRFLPL